MSISDDETKELDSYGVWVKNSDSDITPAEQNSEADLSLDNDSLDLPDFDNEDFSDMFKDDSQFSIDNDSSSDNFANDDDSTLSTDELANITNVEGVSIENVEAPAEDISDDSLELPDFEDSPTFEDTTESEITTEASTEEINFDEIASEEIADEPVVEDTVTEEPVVEEEITEEPAAESEEIDFGADEEISLDDFMEDGFSDESVASGNNGFEPGAEPKVESGETEELSLDDFMDGDSFESAAPEEAKAEMETEDSTPLEMDINFDESAETVETEANTSLEDNYDTDDEEIEEQIEEPSTTEEVTIDDIGDSFTSAPEETVKDESNINTEDIDLSDFGIDVSAEETPITQNVEEAKNKDVVVDYDLSVGDENTTAAPVVNEIADSQDSVSEIEEAIEEPEASNPNATTVDNSLLQQIVADLSGLKDEINKLKDNIAEIKNNESIAQTESTPLSDDITTDDLGIEETKDEGGFFSNDDGDDTIALSFDELDNIMNTAEFNDEPANEEITIDETPADEPVIEETSVEEPVTEPSFDEETPVEDTITEESIEDEPVFEDTISEDSIESEESIQDNDLSFNFEDEKLEEPVMDNISLDGEDEIFTDDDLPSEISIPKEDEMIIESNSSDFMDSVKDSTDEEMSMAENPDISDSLPEEIDDDIPTVDKLIGDEEIEDAPLGETLEIENNEEPVVEETVETPVENNDSFDDVDIFDDQEPVMEETTVEEPVIEEETPVFEEETVTEEEPVTEETTAEEDNFSEVDSIDNNLSDGNIDYLTNKSETSSSDSNSDLKSDIKSVLLYMDQLLENLPEEKIIEFAKSDEFTTYKKLFSELGLS